MMNWFGLLLAFAALLIIGFGFAWVIYGERYLGVLWWPYFMGVGFLLLIVSLFVPSDWGSALLGILGASFVWGSTELKEQAIRAERGWYKLNAKKIPPPLARIIKKWPAPHL